jgi:hypothetical protein
MDTFEKQFGQKKEAADVFDLEKRWAFLKSQIHDMIDETEKKHLEDEKKKIEWRLIQLMEGDEKDEKEGPYTHIPNKAA